MQLYNNNSMAVLTLPPKVHISIQISEVDTIIYPINKRSFIEQKT